MPPALARIYEIQATAAAQGIDPSLAFLDPSLAAGPSAAPANAYTARFNARTGAFARVDARDPSHLSEYERMRRMNDVFFDMNEWEAELEQQKAQENESKKRKKPTKKDLVSLYFPNSSGTGCSTENCMVTGEVQGTKASEENRKNCVAAYLERRMMANKCYFAWNDSNCSRGLIEPVA